MRKSLRSASVPPRLLSKNARIAFAEADAVPVLDGLADHIGEQMGFAAARCADYIGVAKPLFAAERYGNTFPIVQVLAQDERVPNGACRCAFGLFLLATEFGDTERRG